MSYIPAIAKTRRCSRCHSENMHLIQGEDGWSNLFDQRPSPEFACATCGHRIELFDHTTSISAFVIGIAALLAVVTYEGHLFWLFAELFTKPVKSFELMMRDGPLAVILLPLALAGLVLLLVILPIMCLAYALRSLLLRLRNPAAVGAGPSQAKASPAPGDAKPTRIHRIASALWIALIFNVGLALALLGVRAVGGGRSEVEDIMEAMIPPILLSSGLVFGVQRWLVAVFAFMGLPLTSFVVYVLQ